MHINMTVASFRNDIVKAESSVLQLGGGGMSLPCPTKGTCPNSCPKKRFQKKYSGQ